MSDFAFPEAEKGRHRVLGWKAVSIPESQEIDGIPSTARALFFRKGTSILARIFDYEWVVVDKGTYDLFFQPCDMNKNAVGHSACIPKLTIEQANAEMRKICESENQVLFEGWGAKADQPKRMEGKDDTEVQWVALYHQYGPGDAWFWKQSGYERFILIKNKVQKKKETSDKDNDVGVDFAYH